MTENTNDLDDIDLEKKSVTYTGISFTLFVCMCLVPKNLLIKQTKSLEQNATSHDPIKLFIIVSIGNKVLGRKISSLVYIDMRIRFKFYLS